MNIRHRILSSIIYADIFDQPLSHGEIVYWLPDGRSGDAILPTIRDLVWEKILTHNGGYYMVHDHRHLVTLRHIREKISKEKMIIARKAVKILSHIPTVECIAVTGGVSMNNANDEDDIDLCVITSDHTVWMTRLLTTIMFDIQGLRRKPRETMVKNKICLNMVWGKHANPVFTRDWYTAHEILQLRVLFDRRQALTSFFVQNQWVEGIFPHAWKHTFGSLKKTSMSISTGDGFFIRVCRMLEPIVYVLQLAVMYPKRTTEVVKRDYIRFHPKDSRPKVLSIFRKRLKTYHVPLDKHFIHQ